MAEYIDKITATNGTTYDIKDTTSGYITGMTTTAGSHTAGAQTVTNGIITTNIPTKTSHLTNDSGFITTDSDEKLKTTSLSTGTTSYLLSGPAETTAATKYYVPDITAYRNSSGPTYLTVGSASGAYAGGLGLANTGASNGQTIINPNATSNIILTLPNATGTIALTSDIPSIPTVPTITLNGTATTSPSFYAPTTAGTSGYVLKSNGSGAPTWTSATLTDTKVTQTASTTSAWRKVLGSYNSATAADGSITSGTTNISYYDADGPSFNTSTGELYTKGYKMYLATTDSLYTAINNLGWVSAVIE